MKQLFWTVIPAPKIKGTIWEKVSIIYFIHRSTIQKLNLISIHLMFNFHKKKKKHQSK